MNKKILSFLALFSFVISYLSPIATHASQANSYSLSCAGVSVEVKTMSAGLSMANSMSIDEPQVIKMDLDNSCAVVVWNTDKLSTSQVIFAKQGQAKNLDIINSDENKYWGYPMGSVQNNNPQTHHVMIIFGLKKGERYSLRAVSRPHESALPYVSREIYFSFDKALGTQDATANNSSSFDKGQSAGPDAFKKYNSDLMKKYQSQTYKNSNVDIEKFDTTKISQEKTNTQKESGALRLSDEGKTSEKTSYLESGEGRDDLLDMDQADEAVKSIGAADAAKSLTPFWEKIKNFLFGWMKKDKDLKDGENQKQDSSDNAGDNEQNESDASGAVLDEKQENAMAIQQFGNDDSDKDGSDLSATLTDDNEQEDKDLEEQDKAPGLAMSFLLFILPVLIIVGALYALRWFVSRYFDIKEREMAYWMSSFVILSVLFAVLKMAHIALVFLGLFLLALAWHLFKVAVEDMGAENDESDTGDSDVKSDFGGANEEHASFSSSFSSNSSNGSQGESVTEEDKGHDASCDEQK